MRGKGGEEEKEEREGGRREGGREEREGNEKERKPVIPEANKCEIGRGREEGGQKKRKRNEKRRRTRSGGKQFIRKIWRTLKAALNSCCSVISAVFVDF